MGNLKRKPYNVILLSANNEVAVNKFETLQQITKQINFSKFMLVVNNGYGI